MSTRNKALLLARAHTAQQLFSPMTALAMVIFNHILSRISRPESGSCITLTMVAMSVLLADRGKSSNSETTDKDGLCRKILKRRTSGVRFYSQRDVAVRLRWWLGVFTIVWIRSSQGSGV